MTPQAIFDKVVAHLRKQGHPALDADGSICVYRAPNGDRCAVGCLLSAKEYSVRMEGNSISELLNSSGLRLPKYMYKNEDLLCRLQFSHDSSKRNVDGSFNKGWMRKRLKEVAKICKLKYNPPKGGF